MYIQDFRLWSRWSAIKKFLTSEHKIRESRGGLIINDMFIIAKKTSKMRPIGQLDWSWYTPKTLAKAMDEGKVYEYYEMMLKDKRSDPNKWKRSEEEMEKKAFYASQQGRAQLL